MEAELPRNPVDEFKQRINRFKFEDIDTITENDMFQQTESQRHIQQTGIDLISAV